AYRREATRREWPFPFLDSSGGVRERHCGHRHPFPSGASSHAIDNKIRERSRPLCWLFRPVAMTRFHPPPETAARSPDKIGAHKRLPANNSHTAHFYSSDDLLIREVAQ